MTTILLVDDHAVVRSGLKTIIEKQDDLHVIGEAADGSEAIDQIRMLRPDLVVMDLTMPKKSGLEVSTDICKEFPDIKVLVFTMHGNEEYFFPILKTGASGYILKGADSNEILYAIRSVAEGKAYFSPSVAKFIIGNPIENVIDTDRYNTLTQREKEVLEMVANGLTNNQIAAKLFLSSRTVEKHRAKLMDKLNLGNRTDLIRYAISKGLIGSERTD